MSRGPAAKQGPRNRRPRTHVNATTSFLDCDFLRYECSQRCNRRTSLITVPATVSLGMEPHIAIATNMLALTFMSVGGSLPFIGGGAIKRAYLPASIFLTAVVSGLGALLLVTVPVRALRITVAVAMIAVIVFTLAKRDIGLSTGEVPASKRAVRSGYFITFLLAVYGGFFSGGYVTMLTASFVALFA